MLGMGRRMEERVDRRQQRDRSGGWGWRLDGLSSYWGGGGRRMVGDWAT